MAITISGVNNNDQIVATDGTIDALSGFNVVGVLTASSFDVGSNIKLGNAGIITATTFVGNVTGNVNSTSPLLLQTGGSERIRLTGNTEIGIAGANYGTAGQVLTSGGSGNAVSWTTISSGVDTDSQGNTVGGTNSGDNFSTGGYGSGATNNNLFGFDTGTDITSGWDNNCFGYQAGANITTGNNNICIGQQAGFDQTIQNKLIAIGNRAAYNNAVTGTIAIGYRALHLSLIHISEPTRPY